MKTGIDTVGLEINPNLGDITAKVIITPTEAVPGHIIEITDNIMEVVHDTHTHPLTHIILTMTLYIVDHPDTEALQLTLEIKVDHALNQHTNPPEKAQTNHHHNHGHYKTKCIPKGIQALQ